MNPVSELVVLPVPVLCTHIGVAYSASRSLIVRDTTAPSAGAKFACAPPSVLWKLLSPSIDTMADKPTGIGGGLVPAVVLRR